MFELLVLLWVVMMAYLMVEKWEIMTAIEQVGLKVAKQVAVMVSSMAMNTADLSAIEKVAMKVARKEWQRAEKLDARMAVETAAM